MRATATEVAVADAPPAPKHAKLENRTPAMQFLEDSIASIKSTEQHKCDFDRYLTCSHPQHDVILLWWREHECDFKDTAVVARRYLALPATSAQFKQLLSTSGRIVNKMLPPERESLLFAYK